MSPYKLTVMRLADMRNIHPRQDDSRVCATCHHPVGIYPSGQAVLEVYPDTQIECSVCNEKMPSEGPMFLAPGALDEAFETRKKTKQ
jgi:hypothetical protein